MRRYRRRVARLAGEPRDVLGLHVDEVHVARARADVLRGHVAATERVDEAAMRAEGHLAVRRLVVADDDRLAAAQVEPRDRVLVGHAAREAERVDDRVLVALVVPEPRAAERGAERRVVDRDDAAIAARLVMADHDLLVTHLGKLVEEIHCRNEVRIADRHVGAPPRHLPPYSSRAMTMRWISEVPS